MQSPKVNRRACKAIFIGSIRKKSPFPFALRKFRFPHSWALKELQSIKRAHQVHLEDDGARLESSLIVMGRRRNILLTSNDASMQTL